MERGVAVGAALLHLMAAACLLVAPHRLAFYSATALCQGEQKASHYASMGTGATGATLRIGPSLITRPTRRSATQRPLGMIKP